MKNTCRGDVNGYVDVFLEKDCGQSWEEWHGQGQRKEKGRPCKYWCLGMSGWYGLWAA